MRPVENREIEKKCKKEKKRKAFFIYTALRPFSVFPAIFECPAHPLGLKTSRRDAT